MKAQGIKQLHGSPLSVSKDDPHYSALGHALIAKHLKKHILSHMESAQPHE